MGANLLRDIVVPKCALIQLSDHYRIRNQEEFTVSPIKAARQALKAELDHARQGLSFYRSRVEKLEATMEQLDRVDGIHATPGRRAKAPAGGNADGTKRGVRARPAAAAVTVSSDKGSRQQGNPSKRGAAPLPKTGSDFWLAQVTQQQHSAVEIANHAAKALGLDPVTDKGPILVLKQRATPALNGLVAAQRIQDTGAGRDRRFFKA